jgi:rubrerythrin
MRVSNLGILLLAGIAMLALAPGVAVAEDGATIVALETAYSREFNARLQYLAFANRAEREGNGPVACLFRAVARAESVHALRHEIVIEQLGGRLDRTPVSFVVRETAENLRTAIATELRERNRVYPRFAEYARAECLYEALASLNYAAYAEGTHARLFAEALGALNLAAGPARPGPVSAAGSGQLASSGFEGPVSFFICSGDGSVFTDFVKRCPNCGTGSSHFWVMTSQPVVPPALASGGPSAGSSR